MPANPWDRWGARGSTPQITPPRHGPLTGGAPSPVGALVPWAHGYRKKRNTRGGRSGGAKSAQELTLQQIQDMLAKPQQKWLDEMLEESRQKSLAQQMALAGFGAALQGYSHDLWGQTGAAYQQAAAAQQSLAQGLGGQVGSGAAEMRAQQAALGGSLGYTGDTTLPTAEAAAGQVASEGGAKTGEMIGQVGTAWGGYGATRPEYIGFMTGQNQMQVAREQIAADKELRSKFLELQADNPKNALDYWSTLQENKRQNISTRLAQQTLATNIALQRAKLKQSYMEAMQDAKTSRQKFLLDQWYKQQNIALDEQGLTIEQQRANATTKSAEASWWRATHPSPSGGGGGGGFAGNTNYQQKIAKAMDDVPDLLEAAGIAGKKKNRAGYAFNVLWPQIQPYVSPANREAAKRLLKARISKAARSFTPKPSSGGGQGGY